MKTMLLTTSILLAALPAMAAQKPGRNADRLTAPARPPIPYEPMSCIPQGPPDTQQATQDANPSLARVGDAAAKVPMKHGSCGTNCRTHVLAVASGNLDLELKLGLTCPQGQSVDSLSYAMGSQQVPVIAGSTGRRTVSQVVKLQPFSKQDFEAACRGALGGNWTSSQSHPSGKRTVATQVQREVTALGHCTGAAVEMQCMYMVDLPVTCDDRSSLPLTAP
jgi:hypothetical protein